MEIARAKNLARRYIEEAYPDCELITFKWYSMESVNSATDIVSILMWMAALTYLFSDLSFIVAEKLDGKEMP